MSNIYIRATVIICTLVFINVIIKAQGANTPIIINEFSQGPPGTAGDWIELVVTADGTDIRGVYYDDDNTLGTGSIGKEYSVQLKNIPEFSSVNKGSTILIYRQRVAGDGLLDDVDFSDGTLVISQSNSTFLTMTNGITLQADRDEFGIFWDNGDLANVIGIHGVTWGGETGNSLLYASGWGYTELGTLGAGMSAMFTEGTSGQVSTAGNWTVQSYSSATPGTLNGGNNDALPVELSSFSAVINKNVVNLIWKTETEVNNYGFEVQRSSDNKDWEALGFVNGSGNSNSPKNYSFEDNTVSKSGKYSYRLKQIDNDGTYEYSKTIEVNYGLPSSIELKQNYPNPFNPTTTINFTLPVDDAVSLIVYNAIGEQVKVLQNGMLEAGVYSFNFNGDDLPSGLYIYRLSTSSHTQVRKMMLVK